MGNARYLTIVLEAIAIISGLCWLCIFGLNLTMACLIVAFAHLVLFLHLFSRGFLLLRLEIIHTSEATANDLGLILLFLAITLVVTCVREVSLLSIGHAVVILGFFFLLLVRIVRIGYRLSSNGLLLFDSGV